MQKAEAIISLSQLQQNVSAIRGMTTSQLYAVVKANAYGHGLISVAHAIEHLCDGFCVAIVEEGTALRVSGIIKPILVFTPPLDNEDVRIAQANQLILTAVDHSTARRIGSLPCHLKVNTGMNRLGCLPQKVEGLVTKLDGLQGIYSHLYQPQSKRHANRQLQCFLACTEGMPYLKHISASGGILRGQSYHLDLVRVGILLYGYPPQGFRCNQVKSAIRLYANRVQQHTTYGGGVGYQVARKNYRRLTTYRAGYGEGLFRTQPLGEGNLCMDSFLSTKSKERIQLTKNLTRYAQHSGTSTYEVLTHLGERWERIYEK